MPKGPVITVPLTGTYTAPQFDKKQAKPPSGRMTQMDVKVSKQEVSRRMVSDGELRVVHYGNKATPRFVYDVIGIHSKQPLDLTDIAPGEHVHINMKNAHVKNPKELRVKVWDGVKVSVGNNSRLTTVHVDTVSGDHFKARGTLQVSGKPEANYNGKYKFVDKAIGREIQFGQWVKNTSSYDEADSEVVCRHLAAASIKFRQAGGVSWKDNRQNFTPKKAEKLFNSRSVWEKNVADIFNLAPQIFTTNEAIFGRTLAKRLELLAGDLKGDGKIEKNLFTILMDKDGNGDSHAVHIILQVKRENGQESYKVKLFDPNKTMAHFSFAIDDLADLQNKKLTDLGIDDTSFGDIQCAVVPDDWSREANAMRDEFSTERVNYYLGGDGTIRGHATIYTEDEHMSRMRFKKIKD